MPEQIDKANSLPQYKHTPIPRPDRQNRFIRASATYCKCIYVGPEAVYERYREIQVEQEIQMNEEMVSMSWYG